MFKYMQTSEDIGLKYKNDVCFMHTPSPTATSLLLSCFVLILSTVLSWKFSLTDQKFNKASLISHFPNFHGHFQNLMVTFVLEAMLSQTILIRSLL
jgi:hypothetical protein